MKSESEFALRAADWPALLVDGAGEVCAMNLAARRLFGVSTAEKPPALKEIWARTNTQSREQWLAKAGKGYSTAQPLRFRTANAGDVVFQTCVCAYGGGDRPGLLLLQLFPGPTPPAGQGKSGAGEAKGAVAEAMLAQKQRLDCALQLARTVALDFNNALTSILGHTSLILSKMEPGHPWRSSLLEVEKSAEKAAEIAFDLAAFSRQEKDPRAHVAGNLNEVLRRTLELFKTTNPLQLRWSLRLESKLFSVRFDEAKMQQALMKVLDNAVQATSSGGSITVSSSNCSLPEPLCDGTVTLAPGDYVCVEVGDDGCGIPPEVLPRVFEPFFTTKAGHRGLGLAWVYGIVTNHGGSVAISSRAGEGTKVRLYLPAQKKIVRDTAASGDDLRGSQTILMVDDEELLLTMGQMLLSEFGYRVLTANSGEKALEIIASSGEPIDLVVTDLVMPGMSGRELIDRLRQVSPGLRVLSMSGYVRQGTAEEEGTHLQKPFTSQELLRKVKNALS
jgi:two-component system cell cycle sensor histidine kinase/response regulator CckA